MAGGKELVDLEAEIARLGKGGWRRRRPDKNPSLCIVCGLARSAAGNLKRDKAAHARRGTAV